MARSRHVVGALIGAALIMNSTSIARPEDSDGALAQAMAALDPLIGTWEGEGFLRGAADQPKTRTRTRWIAERGFDGRFLRLEFAVLRDDGSPRGEWVGYFTFDPGDGQYHTTWTLVTAGRDYTFHETGLFDPGSRALSLVSHQKRAGADGPETRVDSVFTITGPDSFVVEDTTHEPGSEEGFVSLRYQLRRARP